MDDTQTTNIPLQGIDKGPDIWKMEPAKENPLDKYFVNLPTKEIGAVLKKKVEEYYEYLRTSGRMALWKRCYEFYYRAVVNTSKIYVSGEQNEYRNIKINHYRNLLIHLKTMTTQSRPAFETRATNNDYESLSQTILGGNLLDYYMREGKAERYIKNATEGSIVYGEGWVVTSWDSNGGKDYGPNPETGAIVKEGELEFNAFKPIDVVRDTTKQDAESHDWVILRKRKNRYNLMAAYPELTDKIEALPSVTDSDKERWLTPNLFKEDSDDVICYEFRHKPTLAVPQGKIVEFLDSDLILIEGPIPYRDLGAYRIAAEDQGETSFGYTIGFDLLAVQDAIDMLYSTILTNQAAFGVQNVAVPKGCNFTVTQVLGGLNLLEYDSKFGKPEPLNLTQTPAEIFNFVGILEKVAETLSGVNSVARGNPEASLKSGAALALVQSMSIQFSMNLQQSYAQLLEDVGTSVLNILRDFATVPRVAMVAGKSARSMMKQFTGKDLKLINRVVVDMGNPLSRTTSGRVNLAETLLKNSLVKTPEQYIQVLTTGRLEPVIEGDQAKLLNIKAENEDLADGKSVPVVVTDQHQLHIQEHTVVLASPEARRNPKLIQIVTDHLQEHINIWKSTSPELLQLLGMQPAPAAPTVAPMMNPTNPLTQAADKVNMPGMPNPPKGTDQASADIINQMKAQPVGTA
jgi:protein-tyrosine-phosphatase